jgi:hypothetical protein
MSLHGRFIVAESHPFNEAGRRVKAALISYQLGRAGVDRTLKEVPDDPGEGWAELAESLIRGMNGAVVEKLFPPPKDEGPVQ